MDLTFIDFNLFHNRFEAVDKSIEYDAVEVDFAQTLDHFGLDFSTFFLEFVACVLLDAVTFELFVDDIKIIGKTIHLGDELENPGLVFVFKFELIFSSLGFTFIQFFDQSQDVDFTVFDLFTDLEDLIANKR